MQPLLTIDQSLRAYKHAHKKNPSFGMDIFAEDFFAQDVAIVEKDEMKQKGSPIKFGFFALLLCLSGEEKRTVNQYDFQISKNSFQLIPPGSIFSFEGITEKTEIYIIFFTEDFIKFNKEDHAAESIKSLFEYHKENIDNILLPNNMFTRIKNIYEDINIELHEKKDEYKVVVKLLILKLLFILKREKIEKHNAYLKVETRAEQIAHQYLNLIEKHFLNFKKVSDYADLLQITPKHLTETVKKVLGKNALCYIHQRILQETLYLLEYTNLTITQIASFLNFDTPSEFSRFFKIHHQMTPKQYRLNMRI